NINRLGGMKVTVVIRPTEQTDKEKVTPLMSEYIVDFYKRPRPSVEKVHRLIDILVEQKDGIQYVAEVSGELVGFATLYFTFNTTRADKITVMNDLYVIERFRGTGVAQKLFKTCEQY